MTLVSIQCLSLRGLSHSYRPKIRKSSMKDGLSTPQKELCWVHVVWGFCFCLDVSLE